MQTVLITGGTGMIGQALSKRLTEKGYRVIILTRNTRNISPASGISMAQWDISRNFIDEQAWQEADHIFHLAGANVMAKKWNAAYRKEILESRTLSGRLIAEKILHTPNKIRSVISSSAIGWYGQDTQPPHPFREDENSDPGFLGDTCKQWEESLSSAEGKVNVCRLRTGIVLSRAGGLLKEFELPLRFGIAPIPGSGKQIMSWIHISDLCDLFIYAMEKGLSGSFNAVAPYPVSLKEITLKYASRLRGKFCIPVHAPEFALKLALGERSIEILKSTTVSANKILSSGFQFEYPMIDKALDELAKK
jgi:uncharacterized protein (TIGR01777 family)